MVFLQSYVVTPFPGPCDFLAIIQYLKNFFSLLSVRFCEMDYWLGLHLRPQLTENTNQNNLSVF